MILIMKLPKFKCVRCGHTWIPRVAGRPRQCPHCHQPKWDVPPRWEGAKKKRGKGPSAVALLLLSVACTRPVKAATDHLPLPERLVSARTVLIENDSGDSKLGDAMYEAFREWGRWDVVADRSRADLVAVLDHKDIFIQNNFTLTVFDAKTSERLWSAKRDAGIVIRSMVCRKLTEQLRKRLPPDRAAPRP
jgi:hypothetical protein